MFKQLAKMRRFRKKKDKKSAGQSDPPLENSVENSDDLNSEAASLASDRLSSNSLNPSSSYKSLENGNSEKQDEECDPMASIPTMASSEESILDDRSDSDDEKFDYSIPIEELKTVYLTKHADEDRFFREEMKDLTAYVSKHPSTCEYAKLPQNKEKNRYKNIVTSDKARVVLKRIDDDPFSDYINASYIDGYTKKRKFIATQGPKQGTVNDFWRMVWEQQVHVIVMVTDYRENGKVKCERYFPENGVDQYGNISVECKNSCVYGDYTQTTLAISYTDEEVFENDEANPDEKNTDKEVRNIVHLQCKRWPDHGVPKTTSSIYRLYKKMWDLQPDESESPVLIHCSAGVGRTGTLIGLDTLIERLQSEQTVNVHDTVIAMRHQRTEMVQGLDQYVLLHKLILEHHYLNHTDYTVAEFEERMKKTETENPEDEVLTFDSEFELLSLVPPQNARFGSGSLPQNEDKNRDSKVVPYEHSQVFIRMKPTEMRPPFVNASPLLIYDGSFEMIVTQAPLPTSTEDFWRLVMDNYVTCIVMLTPLTVDDVECCPQYWPIDGAVEYGDITIQFDELISHQNYAETKLSVTANDREKVMKPVTHIQYGSWLENAPIPENCDSVLLEMIAHVDRHIKQLDEQQEHEGRSKTRVLVHCSDGAGRSGVFCTVMNLIQRLKCENKIDVFRTVKDLRDCRPLMVRTQSQYEFCHRTIATYLRSFDLYTNGT